MKSININLNALKIIAGLAIIYFALSLSSVIKSMPSVRLITEDTTTIPSWLNKFKK